MASPVNMSNLQMHDSAHGLYSSMSSRDPTSPPRVYGQQQYASISSPTRQSSRPPDSNYATPGPSSSYSYSNSAYTKEVNGDSRPKELPTPPQLSQLNLGSDAGSQQGSPTTSTAKKPTNPLTDLIDTERVYVDELSCVIKKVAAAWSRVNFPPPALDQMFRAIEAVYRINRTLMGKLEDIGPNPASPKALGDLLMRWIDDLEPAYQRYALAYQCSFDQYEPVQSNPNLVPVLDSLPDGLQSLDALFLLPYNRLRYYKKLYSRLLKSTQEGRSDHRLLIGANEKLDDLIAACDEVIDRSVLVSDGPAIQPDARNLPASPAPVEESPAPTAPLALRAKTLKDNSPLPSPPRSPVKPEIAQQASALQHHNAGSTASSQRFTDQSNNTRGSLSGFSNTQSADNSSRASSWDGQNSSKSRDQSYGEYDVVDLERRLDTARTLDIFTMKPKKCRLQMNPPGLSYARHIRYNGDVSMSFRPSSVVPTVDGPPTEVYIENAHIFLLTDLFLVCERLGEEEQGQDGADMWLMFPPLAGKHLRIQPVHDDPEGTDFEIVVMKRETLLMRCGSRSERERWLNAFDECISFGHAQQPRLRADTSSRPSSDSPTALSPGPLSPSSSTYQGIRGPSPGPGFSNMGQNGGPRARSPNDMPISPSQQSFSALPPRIGSASLQHQSPPPNHYGQAPFRPSSSLSNASSSRGMSDRYQQPNQTNSPHSLQDAGASYRTSAFEQQNQTWRSQSSASMSTMQPEFSSRPDLRPHGAALSSSAGVSDSSSFRSLPSSARQYQHNSLPANQQARQNLASRSLGSLRDASLAGANPPPLPGKTYSTNMLDQRLQPPNEYGSLPMRAHSADGGQHYRAPSAHLQASTSAARPSLDDDSPPASPVDGRPAGPVTNEIIAQMKCKVFLQTSHQQWKSLGQANLKLYLQSPTNVKQLVVDSGKNGKTILISTIVLSDGVERVGKTGVAIELSDAGSRTGIVYMIQLKTEQTASGLFSQFLQGSSRQALG